jgi:hypothetical protein
MAQPYANASFLPRLANQRNFADSVCKIFGPSVRSRALPLAMVRLRASPFRQESRGPSLLGY